MTEDILLRATQALREISAEPEPRSGLTRARILRSAEARAGSGRSSWLRWALTFAGVLAAGGALARLTHHWPEARRGLDDGAEVVRRDPPRQTPATPVETHEALQPTAAALPLPEATAGAPAPAPARVQSPAPEQLRGPAAPPEDELSLFRRARRLHLARDPLALGAWDDYLRVAPHGRHAPEARYARAVCLVRAGRIAEARGELEPFARGEYRGFRKHEAQALLASDELAP